MHCGVTGLFQIFSLNRDAASGMLFLSLPLIDGGGAIVEIMSESIHKHFEALRSDMNGVAIIGINCAMTLSRSDVAEEPWALC